MGINELQKGVPVLSLDGASRCTLPLTNMAFDMMHLPTSAMLGGGRATLFVAEISFRQRQGMCLSRMGGGGKHSGLSS